MADVTFEEKYEQPRSLPAPQKASALTTWVIRSGLAQDSTGAERLMLIAAAIALAAAIAIFVMSNVGGSYEAPPIIDGALPGMTGI